MHTSSTCAALAGPQRQTCIWQEHVHASLLLLVVPTSLDEYLFSLGFCAVTSTAAAPGRLEPALPLRGSTLDLLYSRSRALHMTKPYMHTLIGQIMFVSFFLLVFRPQGPANKTLLGQQCWHNMLEGRSPQRGRLPSRKTLRMILIRSLLDVIMPETSSGSNRAQ
jgi:hypothetical protein